MPGSIWGTGRKRRDDVLNRIMDTIYKGQSIPMGWNYDPSIMQAYTSVSSMQNTTVIDLVSPDGFNLIMCGKSTAGGPDVCG